MDLFDDLPEPEKSPCKPSGPEIPSWNSQDDSFFADLPPPSNNVAENRGTKRKSEDLHSDGDYENAASLKGSSPSKLRGFFAEKKGEREEMQDCHVLLEDFHQQIPHLHPSVSRVSYFAVFDGHGGKRASGYAAEHLHLNLAQKFPQGPMSRIEKEIGRTFVEAFKKTDEDFLKLAAKPKPSWKDGTTAIVVLAVEDTLFIANLGDSKAVLCRYNSDLQKHCPLPLSVDHSPTDYRERMRIQKAGGFVRDGRVMGVIEVSRSLGDGQYKALGVSAVPDVKCCRLSNRDPFFLMACDGLWKVLNSEEVLDAVLSSKKENGEDGICYETACSRLANEAIRKYSGDNVTVVIVSIQKKS